MYGSVLGVTTCKSHAFAQESAQVASIPEALFDISFCAAPPTRSVLLFCLSCFPCAVLGLWWWRRSTPIGAPAIT